jgi:transposase
MKDYIRNLVVETLNEKVSLGISHFLVNFTELSLQEKYPDGIIVFWNFSKILDKGSYEIEVSLFKEFPETSNRNRIGFDSFIVKYTTVCEIKEIENVTNINK